MDSPGCLKMRRFLKKVEEYLIMPLSMQENESACLSCLKFEDLKDMTL